MVVRIGTSGWQYRDWRGPFYPDKLAQARWLESYAERFATCESNNAFYRLPERSTFEAWAARTPPDFDLAVKMSRYLTHILRLREPAEPVERFLERACGLGRKLGPVLLQLPPSLEAEPEPLDDVLRRLTPHVRVAVEFRHRELVHRRDPGPAGAPRRGAVPDGSTPADLAALAHRRLDVPALPRGSGEAAAVLRPDRAPVVGRTPGARMGRRRRCVGLLQQRPSRLRAARRGRLRAGVRTRRSQRDPDAATIDHRPSPLSVDPHPGPDHRLRRSGPMGLDRLVEAAQARA